MTSVLTIATATTHKGIPLADNQPLTYDERRERGLQTALLAAQTVVDNRGQNVTVLDMCDLTAIFDYFVIATGSSQRQLRAMCDGLKDVLEREHGRKRYAMEGYEESRWILCDYGSVVVHLFDEPSRKYYALEDLWASARKVDLTGAITGV